ncbi:MAG: translesion error-prone DNA polymerase V autoproteolytic subunit [SAR324 cluster bacterium]|nr:translesion error-prone DNA polymerase V autoproteolytic subunit [SAR324 cluster bacterium]
MTEYKPRPLSIKSDESISQIWLADDSRNIELPYYDTRVQAGFPSPAEDHLEESLDLNTLVIDNPSATFFVRVAGESMREIGITDGDILVVDRSIESWKNRIVVAVIDSEFTIKRFTKRNGTVVLEAENPDYPSIRITEEIDFSVWGVVCWTLKKL